MEFFRGKSRKPGNAGGGGKRLPSVYGKISEIENACDVDVEDSSVAAVLLMILSSVFWLRKDVPEVSSGEKYVVSSGREVILKLADNKEIILGDSLNLSGVAGEWVSINKVDHRGIVYRLKDSMGIEEEELSYNQIIVPAGERFLVQLSDGTKVWINSESALRYPAYFGKIFGKSRPGETCILKWPRIRPARSWWHQGS